jgi:DNA-binding PadR family transcriptional regulator
MKLTPFETVLLQGWEEVHKKSQLSLWILITIYRGRGLVSDIQTDIRSHAGLEVADQSLYRSLRRLESAQLIISSTEVNPDGPDRKLYRITETGNRVLAAFIERNILSVFQTQEYQKLFKDIVSKERK